MIRPKRFKSKVKKVVPDDYQHGWLFIQNGARKPIDHNFQISDEKIDQMNLKYSAVDRNENFKTFGPIEEDSKHAQVEEDSKNHSIESHHDKKTHEKIRNAVNSFSIPKSALVELQKSVMDHDNFQPNGKLMSEDALEHNTSKVKRSMTKKNLFSGSNHRNNSHWYRKGTMNAKISENRATGNFPSY